MSAQPRTTSRVQPIRKVAVIGAGVMGAGIAAHVANAGIPVVLLDVMPDGAAKAIEKLKKSNPAALMHPANAKFSWLFMALTAICLALFGAAEGVPHLRQKLAASAAIVEGIVFLMLGVVLYRARWGGNIPAWLPAMLPILGAVFAWRLAYRRLVGLEV